MLRALRENDARFRQLAENIDQVFYVTDLDAGRLLYLSPAYERIWGRPSADLMADLARFDEALHPGDQALHAALKEAQARGEPTDSEYRIVRPDGETRWIEDRSFPVKEGGQRLSVGVAQDVTRRHLAEQALRESEQLLRTIGEFSADLIYAKDREGHLLYANPATLAVIGRPLEAALGKNEAEWHDDPEQAAEIMATDRAIMEAGKARTIEERFTTPGGEPRIFLSTKAPMRDHSGAVSGLVGVTTDITERKAQEEQLRRLGETREALLHEVNHRVKNSLQLIVSMLSLQSRQVADPAARALLQDSVARVNAIASLHQKLYVSGGHDRVDFVEFARGLAEATVDSLADRERVTLDVADDGPAVILIDRAVPAALILSELLTNAVKYGSAEGQRRLSVRLSHAGGALAVAVGDDGPGLPPGFDPAKGEGLGLKIVHALLRQLGSRLVHRAGGPGTDVSFTVPLDQ